jgi:hypothetical protein
MRNGRTLNTLLALVAVGIMSVSVYADDPKPDFNGSWKLDVELTAKANGKAAPVGGNLNTRVATDGAQQVAPAYTLVQDEKNLTVKVQGRPDKVWVLDGSTKKGEQTTRGGKMEIALKAKWDGVKIVTSTKQSTMFEGQINETEYKETWSIDKNGHLTFSLDVSTGRGSYKAVYAKQ